MLDRKAGGTAAEVTAWFIHIWRQVLIRSNFEAGCAVLAVAVAVDSPNRELGRMTAPSVGSVVGVTVSGWVAFGWTPVEPPGANPAVRVAPFEVPSPT